MIRAAKEEEIDTLLEITRACAKAMIAKNIFQWNEFYPYREAFVEDFENDELYILEVNDDIIGCITLSARMDDEYVPISWLTENDNNLYIHRLAIHPNHQGNGYAQQLMDFAEDHASVFTYDSIRLDTFSQNERNQKFYEQRCYKRLGDIYFPKQSVHPFYCYELVIN